MKTILYSLIKIFFHVALFFNHNLQWSFWNYRFPLTVKFMALISFFIIQKRTKYLFILLNTLVKSWMKNEKVTLSRPDVAISKKNWLSFSLDVQLCQRLRKNHQRRSFTWPIRFSRLTLNSSVCFFNRMDFQRSVPNL